MIIKSIRLTEGMSSRFIEFSNETNLVHSQQNSKGKTTLLRFILYAIGYNIPNTKKIHFENCEAEIVIISEKVGEIILCRTSDAYIVVNVQGERKTYVLPEQQNELHSIIFGTNNADILKNLLGVFYVDQEKGWTLLNRGVVIGKIHFNIEEFIRGLSGRDCAVLLEQEKRLSRELGKYRQMFSVAKYQETIEIDEGSLAVNSYDEMIDSELEQLKIKQKSLKKELKRIDHEIKDNKQFVKYIEDMKLIVKDPNGVEILVTADNIIGFNDSIDYLIAKHKIISAELSSVSNKISGMENKNSFESEQLSFWESEKMIDIFDRRIASINMDAVAVSKEIKELEKNIKAVRKEISDSTKINNAVVNSLYKNVLKYAVELGVGDDESMAASYLFTSNLKELSGALLHKTVFAFRLAYIIEIKNSINLTLPIILDSPSGKEIDQNNIKLMMNILKRDFSDHQIIIASIFEYDFDKLNVIEIINKLIENE